MFLTLNDMLGKAMLAVVLGVGAACVLSPFVEFGTIWRQCQEDVEEYQLRGREKRPVGFLNGRTYYSREEFAADLQYSREQHLEKWVEQNERMMQELQDRRDARRFGR